MTRGFSLTLALACVLALLFPACSSGGGGTPPTRLAGTAQNSATSTALDDYVEITLTPQGGGAPVNLTCDATGLFTVNLAAGTYDLLAKRPGYADFVQAGIVVDAGKTTTFDPMLDPLPANTYLQSATCAVCHPAEYDSFRRTGHPYKLNKVMNNQPPTYPFSDITPSLGMIADDNGGTDNTLGTPAAWSDVSYVIGGYGWKARFMDQDGYIVTGSEVQYNLATQSMVSYHNDETDKPFNCGNCHTTGWKHYDAVLNDNRQDNRPGIDGTWAEPGIQCEACHGAGSTHAQTMSRTDITKVATARTTADFLQPDMAYGKAVACRECHTRDGEKDYDTYLSAYQAAGGPETEGGRIAASGGLVQHHEQYDELLGVNPDNVAAGSTRSPAFKAAHFDCMTCHSPHFTTVYRTDPANPDPPGARGENADCLVCHPGHEPANANTFGMRNLNCIDCHMPPMAKSAIAGDISSHIFRIDMTKDWQTEQFTADGKFAYPWITKQFACLPCHDGSVAHDRTTLDDTGFNFHN